MKKLTAIHCLAIAVLLGSAGVSWSADFQKGLAAARSGDFATALREWTPLAKQGDADAQFSLGVMYEKGEGVVKDNKAAVKWYTLAAEQGFADAQFNLGVMYYYGHGVPQNYFKAAKWFRKAANQGNADSQSNLGAMYLTGNGVPQDFQLSYIWLSVAAANGAKFALENLNIVTMNLTKDKVNKADSLLKLCQKNPKKCP